MTACLAAPHIAIPALLAIFLPTLVLSPPSLAIDLCCHFETPPIPGFPIILPLGAILGPLSATVDTILALIQSIVDLVNSLLDQLQFSCPLE